LEGDRTNETDVVPAVCELAYENSPNIRTLLRICRDGKESHGHSHFVDDIVYPAAVGATVATNRIGGT